MARQHAGAQRAQRARGVVHQAAAAARAVPIEQIYELYPSEWIAVRVTAVDRRHAISHGEVLAHSPARGDLSAAIIQAHQEDPSIRTYVFHGGPIAFSLDELPRLIDEAEARCPDAGK